MLLLCGIVKFFAMKFQSIDMDQMLLETEKQQDQERSILVNFCCQFPRNKTLIIGHAEGLHC